MNLNTRHSVFLRKWTGGDGKNGSSRAAGGREPWDTEQSAQQVPGEGGKAQKQTIPVFI